MRRMGWVILLALALLAGGCAYYGSGYPVYPRYGVYYGWNYGYQPYGYYGAWGHPHYAPRWGWRGPGWHGGGWGGHRW